eukprot:CAMPEP_0175808106 /NCGR_PEP_ID=MMETSP0107_2-20121207/2079_1 /TAXON_ID=195067 ORGANISM="Goniomonas pacifica, Strain CCMP1869" /NCGR_SAMPLE_ID=MMETSP0107_2 /ASSEMBLY_ACC=CAM_ASM_000203 /LENGTH=172 /DNA_ID=CAMNT_0017119705 /DNA_START=11 /DNA_END=526 /DNA_ORIENTATION=+
MPSKRAHASIDTPSPVELEPIIDTQKRSRLFAPQISPEMELLRSDGCPPEHVPARLKTMSEFGNNWDFASQIASLTGASNFLRFLDWQSRSAGLCVTDHRISSGLVTSHTFVRNVPDCVLSDFCLRHGPALEAKVTVLLAQRLFAAEELLSICVNTAKVLGVSAPIDQANDW